VRFISSSIPRRSQGIKAFKTREVALEEQWARKVNYEELEALRKQLVDQKKENAYLRESIDNANKRIDALTSEVNKYHK